MYLKRIDQILVFAASVSHANTISAVLSATGIESRSITDKSSQQQRELLSGILKMKNSVFYVILEYFLQGLMIRK